MEIKKIQKKFRVTKRELAKYIVLNEIVFLANIALTPRDIELLSELIHDGTVDVTAFCIKMGNPQSVRNRLVKLEKLGLIDKQNKYNKTMSITDKYKLDLDNLLYEQSLLCLQ